MSPGQLPDPADVLLADGSLAVLRPVAPGDGPALHALHAAVSDDTLRLRFFVPSRRAAHRYVDHVVADAATLSLVAVRRGRVLGLGTAEPVGPATSEVAFLVADDAHGLGVGTLLLEHLAALALARGITHFEAEVLADNHPMLAVFADAGLPVSRRLEAGSVVVALTTGLTEDGLALADARQFRAQARSLRPLLRPSSVAVVGVRSDGTGVGARVLSSIVAGGFTGRVLAVTRRAAVDGSVGGSVGGSVDGAVGRVTAVRSLEGTGDAVDLAVVSVPAAAVTDVVRSAGRAGVPAVVVLASGFAELGAAGAAVEAELVAVAREHGTRLVGPNCLGLVCNAPAVRLAATFGPARAPAGGLALASHSGGVGIVLLDLAAELGLGVHSFVSLGNAADVGVNDLLAAWYDDPEVAAAGLYLESFADAATFARFARRFAERKPLLAVVGGRSASGSRAGESHTGAAATPAAGADALFAQAGVVGCADAEELAATALLLEQQPLPAGTRVAVVGNAGGLGVLAADAAVGAGLRVPELSPALRERLGALVSGTAGTSNPVDAGAGASPDRLAAVLGTVLASGEVDAALVVLVAVGDVDGGSLVRAVVRARQEHPRIPVVMVPAGRLPRPPAGSRVTCFRTSAVAVRALAHAARYAAWRAVPRSAVPLTPLEVQVEHRRSAERLLAEAGGGWLRPDRAAALLAPYGLDPVGVVARDAEDALRVAERIGYPVVVKAAAPEVLHRTERGLVRVGLTGPAQVRAAVAAFDAELGRASPVLVQPLARGVEVAVGAVRDATLGPLVMVAAGGVGTEVLDDRTFLLPPFAEHEADRALAALRIRPLLDGFRGAPPGDLAGLRSLVVAAGRLVVDLPEVAELDLNPVLVGPDGCVVADVKVRLAPASGPRYGAPRQLTRLHRPRTRPRA